MKKILLMVMLSMAALSASAEKADSAKQTVINYDSLDVDDVAQTSILNGNVVITKGTLLLKSDKAVIKESPDGYRTITLTATGKNATFRQKRDAGPNLWVEGEASRIEYDERTEIVKLFSNAKLRELEGVKPTRTVESEYITYDGRREQFATRNDASGENRAGKGRATMIIAPRKPGPAAAPAPAGTPAPAPAAPAGAQ